MLIRIRKRTQLLRYTIAYIGGSNHFQYTGCSKSAQIHFELIYFFFQYNKISIRKKANLVFFFNLYLFLYALKFIYTCVHLIKLSKKRIFTLRHNIY